MVNNKNEVNKENMSFLSTLEPQKMLSECDQTNFGPRTIKYQQKLQSSWGSREVVAMVQANYPEMNIVFQQNEAPEKASKKAQKWLEDNMPFWPKNMRPSYSPDANPLVYTFLGASWVQGLHCLSQKY